MLMYIDHDESIKPEIEEVLKKERKKRNENITKLLLKLGIPWGLYKEGDYKNLRKKFIFNQQGNDKYMEEINEKGHFSELITIEDKKNSATDYTNINSLLTKDPAFSEIFSIKENITNEYKVNDIDVPKNIEYWDEKINRNYQNFASNKEKKAIESLNAPSVVENPKPFTRIGRRPRIIVTSEEESPTSESIAKKRRGRPAKKVKINDSENEGYSDDGADLSEDSLGDSDDFIDDEDLGLRRSSRYRNIHRNSRRNRNRRKCTDSFGNTRFQYISGNEEHNQPRRNQSYDFKERHLGKRSQMYYNDFDEYESQDKVNYTTRARTKLRHEDNNVASKRFHEEIEDKVHNNNLPPTQCYRCLQGGAQRYCENYDQCKRAFHDSCCEVRGSWNLRSKIWYCFECTAKNIYIKEKEKSFNSLDTKYIFENSICERMWCDITELDLDGLIPQIGDKFYFIPQAYEYFISRFFEMLNFVDDPFENAKARLQKEQYLKEGLQSIFGGNLKQKSYNNEENQSDLDSKQDKEKEKLDKIKVWPFENSLDLVQNERLVEIIDVAYEFPCIRNRTIEQKYKKYLTI